MVATTDGDKGREKEVKDAEDAKKEADPAVDDPAFMPNIEPQTGDDEDKE